MRALTAVASRPQGRLGRPVTARRADVACLAGWRQAVAAGRQGRRRAAGLHARAFRDSEEEDDDDDEEEEEEDYEEDYDVELEDDCSMRIYLDSADVGAWEKWAEAGLVYGFTTNPTILRRDKVPCTLSSMRHLAREAFDLGAAELQLQAWGSTPRELYNCGMDLYALDDRIVVKVPITLTGLKAARLLSFDGVPFTLTGVYSTHQVVTALALGANYAAPYLGRMNDAGKNGVEAIAQMQSIIDQSTNTDGETRLLVASIRKAEELAVLAAEGCNTFTISPHVAAELVNDPLTIKAAEVFEADAREMGAGTEE